MRIWKRITFLGILVILAVMVTACNREGNLRPAGSVEVRTSPSSEGNFVGSTAGGTASSGTQTAAVDNELRIGSSISGHAYSYEVNSYNFRTAESGRIVLEIESDIAIYLEVYDNDEFIATNGDDFGNMNSRLEFSARNTVYRLEVRSYVRNSDGNFRITARQAAAAAGNTLAGRTWQFQSGAMLYFFNHYRELTTVDFSSDGNVYAEGSGFSVSGRWQITGDGRLEIRPDNKGGELNIPAVLYFSYQFRGNLLTLTDENPNFGAAGDAATYYEIFPRG